MKLYIVLLNYNNDYDTLECVKSIKSNCKIDYNIVVVDNNSSEESKNILLKNKNLYKLILNNENRGFAAGNNIGIKYALENNADYVLLLNNDTIITQESIEMLLECFIHEKELGMVSSRIMYYDNPDNIWFCNSKMNWFKYMSFHDDIGQKYDGSLINKEVDFISGCCMLIKREVFEVVGLLPEEYFMYFEDVDYCKMVKDSNYKIMVCPKSVIYHKVSSSSGGESSSFSVKWLTRNRIIFMNKYKRKTLYWLSCAFFYTTRIIKILVYLFKGQSDKAKAIIEGIKEGYRYIKKY